MTVTELSAATTQLEQSVVDKLRDAFPLVNDEPWEGLTGAELRAILLQFVNEEGSKCLLFRLEGKKLVSSATAPSVLSQTCLFLVKNTSGPLHPDEINDNIAYGQIGGEAKASLGLLSTSLAGHHGGNASCPEQDETCGGLVLPPRVEITALQAAAAGNKDALSQSMILQLESSFSVWLDSLQRSASEDIGGASHAQSALEVVAQWRSRVKELAKLQSQLYYLNARLVFSALKSLKSYTVGIFETVAQEVAAAVAETQGLEAAIKKLNPLLEDLSNADDVMSAADATTMAMHGVYLAARCCPYVAAPSRHSALLSGMAQDLCGVVQRCSEGPELLRGDPTNSVDKTRRALRTLGHFKSCYTEYRSKSAQQGGTNCWRVPPAAAFGVVDALLARCHNVYEICTAAVQYAKLEKVDIGGPEGALLALSTLQLYSEFTAVHERLAAEAGDPLDLNNAAFPAAMSACWCSAVSHLDARLATLVLRALSGAPTPDIAARMLESFEGAASRPVVSTQLERVHLVTVKNFSQDIRSIEAEFAAQRGTLVQSGEKGCDMSSAAGLSWVKGLKDRLAAPLARMKAMPASVHASPAGQEMSKAVDTVLASLTAQEAELMSKWCASAVSATENTLSQHVLAVKEGGEVQINTTHPAHLRVNINPELSKLMKEARVLMATPRLQIPVPPNTLHFFQKEESLLQHVTSLGKLVAEINAARNGVLPEEAPLLTKAMAAAEAAVHDGLQHITWASAELPAYVDDAGRRAGELSRRWQVLKDAAAAAEFEVQLWHKNMPLFTDGGRQGYSSAHFRGFQDWLEAAAAQRAAAVVQGQERLGTKLSACAETLGVHSDAPEWLAFCVKIASLASRGLNEAVAGAFEAAACLFSSPHLPTSMLTVELHTGTNSPEWHPHLSKRDATAFNEASDQSVGGAVNVFLQAIAGLAAAPFTLPTQPAVLAAPSSRATSGNTQDVVTKSLITAQKSLSASLKVCEGRAAEVARFAELWQPSPTEITLSAGPLDASQLNAIEKGVLKLKTWRAEACNLPSTIGAGWLAASLGPAKQALVAATGKRIAALTDAVKSKVERSMEDISKFVNGAKETLEMKIELAPSHSTGGASTPRGASSTGQPETLRRASQATTGLRSDSHSTFTSFRASVTGRPSQFGQKQRQSVGPPLGRRASNAAQLYSVLRCLNEVGQRVEGADADLKPLTAAAAALERCGAPLGTELAEQLRDAPTALTSLQSKASARREVIGPVVAAEAAAVKQKVADLAAEIERFRAFFLKSAPFGIPGDAKELTPDKVDEAFSLLDALAIGSTEAPGSLQDLTARAVAEQERCALLGLALGNPGGKLELCKVELGVLRLLWEEAASVLDSASSWTAQPWASVDVDSVAEGCKTKSKDLKALPRQVRDYEAYKYLDEKLKGLATVLPLLRDLAHPAMRPRHWAALAQALGATLPADASTLTLGMLLALKLDRCADTCAEVVDTAKKEAVVERALAKMEGVWKGLKLEFPYMAGRTDELCSLAVDEAVTEALESDATSLQNMAASKIVAGHAEFRGGVATWQRRLGAVDAVIGVWTDAQRKWSALEAIFCNSADIRTQLPQEAVAFDAVNEQFKELMRAAPATPGVLGACSVPGRKEHLEAILRSLELRERALQDYMETKRTAFPRFYFVAPADLLDILAKGADAHAVEKHLPKLFDNLHRLEWKKDAATGERTRIAIGMYSGEGEYVPFAADCPCEGPAEIWLARVVDSMRAALCAEYKLALPAYEEKPRVKWIMDWSAQNTVVVSRTYFTQEVNDAFAELERGNEDAMKGVYDRQKAQLADLIALINGPLSKNERKKLITLCTIDVHARDVAGRLIEERCEAADAFQWQSQLRYGRDTRTGDPLVSICDATIPYQFEYIGNCGCLCITPLTDRCYITLTQAQRLILGGAPAGPAGTGKTETVKDLARALGVQCYVFNCSDQLDFKAMGQIYKGLAQTGAWGCFDEFNRIPVPVLSVCSTQYKSVLDALRARKERFVFEGIEIPIRSSAMAFITMNPGYVGRAELPESLKALFRPVSMAAPDLALICEIMLMAEGFQAARPLARKFISLYRLCEDLLSKSKHYDWKLRAIKTTLYVAGGMKRAAPELSEERVMLRALRDFNLGKLTADDASVFAGLLEDLFPSASAQVPRAIDITFEDRVKQAALELGYQPDPTFLLKVSQLREIFEVRWSVFLLGPAGSGKTAVWRTLQRALTLSGEKTIVKVVNPKSVTRDELYGSLHPQTREWREGLLSVTFREMASTAAVPHQWIVLDGDIDPEWIESMNTVMDDNKVLTLASNERIPLAPSMRLLLEINHMNHATPATVSRGGVIFVNGEDVGWRPLVDSWIGARQGAELRASLPSLFDRVFEPAAAFAAKHCTATVPQSTVNQADTLCKMLEGLLPQGAVDKRVLESQFAFACIWAVGGCLLVDKLVDHRAAFSKWWAVEHKYFNIPVGGTVFDYFVDLESGVWTPWSSIVPVFDYSAAVAAAGAASDAPGSPMDLASIFVSTVETVRLQFLMRLLLKNGYHAMLVGSVGTGKTAVVKDLLASLDQEAYATCVLPLNSFHDGPAMQAALEAPLERKAGARYGPPGTKRLVCFVDDTNMPAKDKYETQSALELLRQGIDSKGWFDKQKATAKEVTGVQYLAAMNPTTGSFTVSQRLQRQFAAFAVPPPARETTTAMFSALLGGHLAGNGWDEELRRLGPKLINATVELHKEVVNTFVPSAVRFHYLFSLREVAAVVGGLLRMTPAAFARSPLKAARLWAHECERVYADRLTTDSDVATFTRLRTAAVRRHLTEALSLPAIEARPLLFSATCHEGAAEDSDGSGPAMYDEVPSGDALRRSLERHLADYNESNPAMDLVIFPQAAEHVARVARVLDVPGGHAMLVGVGGSGKQSLARLAAHAAHCEAFQITITAGYGVTEFNADLLALYHRCVVKSARVAFLLTDTHIVDDRFLVYINELLSTGHIAELVPPEDKEVLCSAVKAEVRAGGGVDTPEACWRHVLAKIRRNLHVVLCFSPVGDRLRVRSRRFPALVACCAVDWLRPWPRDALESVAERSLRQVPALATDDSLRTSVAAHMASSHVSVEAASRRYLEQYRRYNYTTPKSYLELVAVYCEVMERSGKRLAAARGRLESGVDKIEGARASVEGLRVALIAEQQVVEEKKANTQTLIESIGKEKAAADEAVAASRGDEDAAAALATKVTAVQTECASDLSKAEPVIAAAEAALSSLDKASLGELKSFSNPASEVIAVVSACMVLTAPGGAIPKELGWAAGKKWMGAQALDALLKSLLVFDKDNVPAACVDRVERDFLSQPTFKAEAIRVKSVAAAGLAAWVINICKYFRIYQVVAPKRAALAEANKKLADANKRLSGIRAKVAELTARVAALETGLAAATAEKVAAEAQAERTAAKAALADRLIRSLGSEFERWSGSIEEIKKKEGTLVGDALLAAAFVSYAAAFNAPLREHLVGECWLSDALRWGIPIAPTCAPLDLLTSSSSTAVWSREGLQGDKLSVENAAVVTSTRRWPLLIDPQLQGVRWVKGMEGPRGLTVLRQGAPKFIEAVVRCVEEGTPLLIENLSENIDAALEPLVARQVVRRGRSMVMILGGREVTFHPDFKLYLHTKLPNPHYPPETAAQTTLVNFAITPTGLEEQLLAAVVSHEAAELQEKAAQLEAQLLEFTVTLQDLEDDLLARLAASKGDILDDTALVTSLEQTKATAAEVAAKVANAKVAEIELNAAREVYRPVASRGALLYFFMNSLSALDRVYWFSMASFIRVLQRSMDATPPAPADEGVTWRVDALLATVTETVFSYVSRGLFERHKPVAAAQLCFAVLRARGELIPAKFDFLLRGPQVHGKSNPHAEWLPSARWASALALGGVDGYSGLVADLEISSKRWKEWCGNPRPEDEALPGDWKRLPPLDRLLAVRALRPDRLPPALASFVSASLGPQFASVYPFDLEAALQDAGPSTPVLIFVSPGVDASAAVEAHAREVGVQEFSSVSLGQGQEALALAKLRAGASSGGWVLLQNVHLTMDWTWKELDRAVDGLAGSAPHPSFQLFLSAEPPPSLERPLPPSLLQSCVKLSNEPPQGLHANLARAWSQFDDDTLDACARQTEYRAVLFALCFFHAAVQERKKFGVGNMPGAKCGVGWNMGYPFSAGDLRCCAQLAANYIDVSAKIPWEDLRYMVGEIMYGGHVVEGWDRRLVSAYLQTLLSPSLLEGGKVCAGVSLPPPAATHAQIDKYIRDTVPNDGAVPLGLHPNAEIGVALRAADEMCAALQALQGDASSVAASAGAGGPTVEERARAAMDAVLENLPHAIDAAGIRAVVASAVGAADQSTGGGASSNVPFGMVVVQEADRMNALLVEVRSSLADLALGLKGDLAMSETMESLAAALAADRVPASWAAAAFPSLRPLGSWLKNLSQRHTQLADWASDPLTLPCSVWLPGLFNPVAFLTAVLQVAARKSGWALDATVLVTEVTKKTPAQVDAPPREGAYIHGLWLQGAWWNEGATCLEESKPKEVACSMPVLHVKAVPADKDVSSADAFPCPVYTTEARFRQEVFTVNLRGGKASPAAWAAAGVALLLDVV